MAKLKKDGKRHPYDEFVANSKTATMKARKTLAEVDRKIENQRIGHEEGVTSSNVTPQKPEFNPKENKEERMDVHPTQPWKKERYWNNGPFYKFGKQIEQDKQQQSEQNQGYQNKKYGN